MKTNNINGCKICEEYFTLLVLALAHPAFVAVIGSRMEGEMCTVYGQSQRK
jgi:hypothetical protein